MKDYAAEAAAVQSEGIHVSADVVKARQAVRVLSQQAGLSLVNQTKLVTAASELGRNTLIYGGGGTYRAAVVKEGGAAACGWNSPTRDRAYRTSTWPSPTAGSRATAWDSA